MDHERIMFCCTIIFALGQSLVFFPIGSIGRQLNRRPASNPSLGSASHKKCAYDGLKAAARTRTREVNLCLWLGQGPHTVDGQTPAPPKKPWNDDSPVNTNNCGFPGFQSGAGFRLPTVGLIPKVEDGWKKGWSPFGLSLKTLPKRAPFADTADSAWRASFFFADRQVKRQPHLRDMHRDGHWPAMWRAEPRQLSFCVSWGL